MPTPIESFELILHHIKPFIERTSVKIVPTPIENHRQFALAIYRIAHGYSLKVLKDLFCVFQSL